MLQAQMIKTNGRYQYKYSNSKTDTINAMIISQDYDKNKMLLLSLSYDRYIRYYQPLSVQYNLGLMLSTILSNLTPDEAATIYCTEPVVIPPPEPPPVKEKTYYVVTRFINPTTRYFIFKNYAPTDSLIPSYEYTFDLSDPTNKKFTIGDIVYDTILSFSYNKGDPELTTPIVTYTGTPGEPGSIVTLVVPKDIKYDTIFPFNSGEPDPYRKYNLSGYTVESFYVQLNAFSQLKKSCDTLNQSIPPNTPYIYVYNDKYYELVLLTPSSMIYVYDYNGPTLSMRDIKSRENMMGIAFRKFGLYKDRTYYLYVPKIYALALLNKNQTSNITYTGSTGRKQSASVYGTGNDTDGDYDFYYGTIEITVTGSFQPISFYTLNYGYIHAYQILVYSDEAASIPWDTNPYKFPF